MRVKSVFTNFFVNRLVIGFGIASVMFAIFLIASSFTKHSDRDLRAKQTNLVIRQIGHQLLLQSGDANSRVLPVTENKEGTFLLQFENEFTFSHDSLMLLTQRLLSKTQFPSGYTVTVHECTKANITYGFQINKNSPDILACQGRNQPRGCYTIEIVFPDLYKTTSDYPVMNLVYSGTLLLLSVTLLIGRFGKTGTKEPAKDKQHTIINESVTELPALGKFLFDIKSQRLLLGKEAISLTDKECRILELLYKNSGELIPRETLMEKIWLSEGVITGRSLDMFVSKLRKKLSGDPGLRITNVHGKGYKLEVNSSQHS